MNPAKGTALADKIAGILNTAPSTFDPEEEVVDDTIAQIAFGQDEDPTEEEILSQFRKHNVDLLADVDEKYAGKKTSRKNLRDSDESSLSEAEEFESSDDQDQQESEENEEEEEEEEEDDDDDDQSDLLSEDNSEGPAEDGGDSFKHLSDSNVSTQLKKGICVRNQMSMWENLLEIRIQLQRCLVTANKMPTSTKFKEIKTESGPEFNKKATDVKNTLLGTLDKLLLLQREVLKQYPETRNLAKQNATTSQDEQDEEIPSDTDPELSEPEEKADATPAKKRKLQKYEKDIDGQHKKYENYRNEVIKKWHDKTKVVLKGGATSHSVLDQIEYNLTNNRDKLVKRTQLKKSQYNIVGQDDKTNEDRSGEEYHTEIFDDDDFYHHLLRELIEVKSADITDPIQLGRQWIQLQSMRSKMKRKIDTRATKGRKIRYMVHKKLVNFMAPIEEGTWTDEARDELYGSLFGKNQPVLGTQ